MAARHEEECYEKTISICVHVCKGLSKDDVGIGSDARGIVLEENQPGAGFKTGDFVEEKLGGLP